MYLSSVCHFSQFEKKWGRFLVEQYKKWHSIPLTFSLSFSFYFFFACFWLLVFIARDLCFDIEMKTFSFNWFFWLRVIAEGFKVCVTPFAKLFNTLYLYWDIFWNLHASWTSTEYNLRNYRSFDDSGGYKLKSRANFCRIFKEQFKAPVRRSSWAARE